MNKTDANKPKLPTPAQRAAARASRQGRDDNTGSSGGWKPSDLVPPFFLKGKKDPKKEEKNS